MDNTLLGLITIVVIIIAFKVLSIQLRKLQLKKPQTFAVTGFVFIYDSVKSMVHEKLKPGDLIELEARPNNEYDNKAVRVIYRSDEIGWVPTKYKHKKAIFKHLMQKGKIEASCKKFIANPEHEIITITFKLIK